MEVSKNNMTENEMVERGIDIISWILKQELKDIKDDKADSIARRIYVAIKYGEINI